MLEAYINITRDMYDGCKISVMTSAGNNEQIDIGMGLRQGFRLSPLLFVIIIDMITEEIEEGTPWQFCSRTTWCYAFLIER